MGIICLTLLLILVEVFSNRVGSSHAQESCNAVNNRCMSRVGCGMAWQYFILGCNSLIFGETTVCTEQCTRALMSLLSTEGQVGVGFTDCDCGADTECLVKKERIEDCSKPVLEAIRSLNDSTVIDCNLATWLCEADSSCQMALMYYKDHCERLMEGVLCTTRCNNSLAILYRQAKAAKLINCSCQGAQNCMSLKVNMDRLCFHKTVAYKLRGSAANTATFGTSVFALIAWVVLVHGHRVVL